MLRDRLCADEEADPVTQCPGMVREMVFTGTVRVVRKRHLPAVRAGHLCRNL